jgi:pimeloyl-ACP methyl ester carboxylesterase
MRRGIAGRLRIGLLGAVAAVASAAALALPAAAGAITYAPVNQPGPALSVPQAALDASLQCSGSLAGATRTPVLLVPGTGSDPEEFAWNWEPRLSELGIPWCAVTLPKHGLSDIQDAGEYVVNAIRTMSAQGGRRISIIGHSQGGMLPRWALRFWPDTRGMVDDDIGFAASNHGTTGSQFVCNLPCPESFWQQSNTSAFIKALNSYQETFPGISYTEVYSHNDEIVTPNSDDNGSSSLHGGGGEIENEAIQDICPLDLTEHNGLPADNVAYALAIDALDNPGPANPSRIDPSVCSQPFMPGVGPEDAPAVASTAAHLLANIAGYPGVTAEPPLKCYVTATCPASGLAAKRAKCKKKKKKRKHHAVASKRKGCKKRHKRR